MERRPLAKQLALQTIPCINDILDGDLCNKFFISIFSLFLVFKHDFIGCVGFNRIAALNTASDDVTNYVTHRLFNADLSYSCTHFVVVIDAKSRLNGAF